MNRNGVFGSPISRKWAWRLRGRAHTARPRGHSQSQRRATPGGNYLTEARTEERARAGAVISGAPVDVKVRADGAGCGHETLPYHLVVGSERGQAATVRGGRRVRWVTAQQAERWLRRALLCPREATGRQRESYNGGERMLSFSVVAANESASVRSTELRERRTPRNG